MQAIEVTGSNAKGTTVALLSSIFRARGDKRVGTFIARPDGRWTLREICDIDGRPVELYSDESPFSRLRRGGASVAVVEGTDTATSREPDATMVLTMVCADGGQSALERCRLKADVCCRPDTPVIAGRMPSECKQLVETLAAERGARLIWAHDGVSAAVANFDGGFASFVITTPMGRYSGALRMRGRYQVDNAVVAVRTAELFDIPTDVISAGLSAAQPLGARLEYVRRSGRTVLLDFLKNAEGARVLAEYLHELHSGAPILVTLKSHQHEVHDILSSVGPVTFSQDAVQAIPDDVEFCTVAGPNVSEFVNPPDLSQRAIVCIR